jgi:hypothetical protein
MPSRRSCSPGARPQVGRAARHIAASHGHRARPRPAGRLRLAGGEREPVPLHAALLVGTLAVRDALMQFGALAAAPSAGVRVGKHAMVCRLEPRAANTSTLPVASRQTRQPPALSWTAASRLKRSPLWDRRLSLPRRAHQCERRTAWAVFGLLVGRNSRRRLTTMSTRAWLARTTPRAGCCRATRPGRTLRASSADGAEAAAAVSQVACARMQRSPCNQGHRRVAPARRPVEEDERAIGPAAVLAVRA